MSEFDNPEIFRSILENLPTGVYLVDRNRKILFWNNGAEEITGYLRQDVVGRFLRDHLLTLSGEVKKDSESASADPLSIAFTRSLELRNALKGTSQHPRGLDARLQSPNWDRWTWSREFRIEPTWKRICKRVSRAFRRIRLASAFWLWKQTEWITFALRVDQEWWRRSIGRSPRPSRTACAQLT